jgi:outer membrane protein assembly factor BamB
VTILRACLLMLGLLLASSATGQEWTRFRGPNGSGLGEANQIPLTWTDQDFAWKVPIPGTGHSSPVCWGKKLFLTSCEKATGTRIILGLDADTGKTLWKRTLEAEPYHTHRRNTFASSTPTVDDTRLYVCWATPEKLTVLALDHQGNEVWVRDLGRWKGGHGFAVSPILHEDLLILANDQDGKGVLLGLQRKTGTTAWEIPRHSGNATYSTPCVYQGQGGPAELIFTNWKHGMTSVDPATGKVNWELSIFEPDKKERAIASPVVAGDLVLGTCGFVTAQKHLVAVRPPQKPGDQPREVWRISRPVAYLPTPLVKGGLVFLCTEQGIASCLEVETGKSLWERRLRGTYSASPVCAGERIYCTSDEGDVTVLRAGPEFAVLGRGSLGEATQSTPALANGRIYFRTRSHLLALGKGKAE